MAGELQLGGTTLATHTGSGASAKINLDSGLVFPAGNVVQFVYTSSDTEYLSTSTSTYTDLTDFSLSITPTHINSKILMVLSGTINSGSQNQVNLEMISQINGSNAKSFHWGRVNTDSIVELSDLLQVHRIYEHGQTSNFTALNITYSFKRYTSNTPFGDSAFNYNGIFTNTAYSYAMEIA
jgi:hypothetical protein